MKLLLVAMKPVKLFKINGILKIAVGESKEIR